MVKDRGQRKGPRKRQGSSFKTPAGSVVGPEAKAQSRQGEEAPEEAKANTQSQEAITAQKEQTELTSPRKPGPLIGPAAESESEPKHKPEIGERKMADAAHEASRGFSEAMDRTEEVGRSLNRTTQGVFDKLWQNYQAFFSIHGARRLAEAYIETNERIAKESLDFGRKFVELSAGGARRLWQVAEEQRREAENGA
jgi:hypothetical protein